MAVQFRYFRSVAGYAVPRYGSRTRAKANQLIGAVRVQTSAGERRAGTEPIQWDTEAVVALPVAWCARYAKELARHLRRGELIEVKAPKAEKAEAT